ncbi:MAG: hypothetical protein LBL42_06260, partial [Tannerella sp.]|nr:hypothetical protein [Tannerella sp.]
YKLAYFARRSLRTNVIKLRVTHPTLKGYKTMPGRKQTGGRKQLCPLFFLSGIATVSEVCDASLAKCVTIRRRSVRRFAGEVCDDSLAKLSGFQPDETAAPPFPGCRPGLMLISLSALT